MAGGGCCSLRCYTYFIAILTFVSAILQFIRFDTQAIVGGIFTLVLSGVLFWGVHKEKAGFVLGYLITQIILIIILIVFAILALVGLHNLDENEFGQNRQDTKDAISAATVLVVVYIVCVAIWFLLILPVFFYWRQLSRRN